VHPGYLPSGGPADLNLSEGTSSTSFTDLDTPGPIVTCETGSAAMIVMTAEVNCNTASQAAIVGVDISGATSTSPDGINQIRQETNGTTEFQRCSTFWLNTALNPGVNTFKLQYRVVAGSGSFNFRDLIVLPL
jgi:hypothetical protein